MILLIDNYDSFVFNLARYVAEAGYECRVVRNDKITLTEIESLAPEKIILSPGPCAPDQAGICLALIRRFAARVPLLGVCLGHQAIAQAFGGHIECARQPMHGKASAIVHDGRGLFVELDNPLTVGRYHSLIVSETDFPPALQVTARSEVGEVMALAHRYHPVFGVQFHPESILTPAGSILLQRFLSLHFPHDNFPITTDSH